MWPSVNLKICFFVFEYVSLMSIVDFMHTRNGNYCYVIGVLIELPGTLYLNHTFAGHMTLPSIKLINFNPHAEL